MRLLNHFKFCCVLIVCSLASLAQAQERNWRQTFDTFWESRWQQSGLPINAIKWPDKDKKITFSINASASRSNAKRAREAITEVASVIGWTAVELPADSKEAQVQFLIRTFDNEELRQFICWVNPDWDKWLYTQSIVTIAEQGAYYCLLHEMMHVFGYPGHPKGDTVLSYFESNRFSLSALDRFMLKAWYSDDIKPGASPMLAVRALNRLWIEQQVPQDQRADARKAEQVWYDELIKVLDGFALGKGEPPTILYRSGLLSEEGKRNGRRILQGLLGHDYLHGSTVPKNLNKASELLLANAKGGNLNAGNFLAYSLANDAWDASSAKPLCEWLRDTPLSDSRITEEKRNEVMGTQTCSALSKP
jgi:hypothetical protein